jgi:hypothetical protein
MPKPANSNFGGVPRSLTILAPVVTTFAFIGMTLAARGTWDTLIPVRSTVLGGRGVYALVFVVVCGPWYLARRGVRLLSDSDRSVWPSLAAPAAAMAIGAWLQLSYAVNHPYWLGHLRVSAEVVSEALPVGATFGLLAGSFCCAIAVQIGIRELARVTIVTMPPRRILVATGISLAGFVLVVDWGGLALTITGVLGGLAGIGGVVLASLVQERSGSRARIPRLEILAVTVLSIGSAMVAMLLGVYHRLFALLGGESVDPALKVACAVIAFEQLRVVIRVYPLLLVVSSLPFWGDLLSGSIRLAGVTLTRLGEILLWILPCLAGLVILVLEPYKHIAVFTLVKRLPASSDVACRHAKLCDDAHDYSCFVLDRESRGANIKCLVRLALGQIDVDGSGDRSRFLTIAERFPTSFREPFDDLAPIRGAAQLRLARTGETGDRKSTRSGRLSLTGSKWHFTSTAAGVELEGKLDERLRRFAERIGCDKPISLSFDEDVSASEVISLVGSCEPGVFVFDSESPARQVE